MSTIVNSDTGEVSISDMCQARAENLASSTTGHVQRSNNYLNTLNIQFTWCAWPKKVHFVRQITLNERLLEAVSYFMHFCGPDLFLFLLVLLLLLLADTHSGEGVIFMVERQKSLKKVAENRKREKKIYEKPEKEMCRKPENDIFESWKTGKPVGP